MRHATYDGTVSLCGVSMATSPPDATTLPCEACAKRRAADVIRAGLRINDGPVGFGDG